MPILIQQCALLRIVHAAAGREGMPDLGKLSEHVGCRWRNVRSTVVARDAILLVRPAQQSRGARGIVRGMTRTASILRDGGIPSNRRLIRRLAGADRMRAGHP